MGDIGYKFEINTPIGKIDWRVRSDDYSSKRIKIMDHAKNVLAYGSAEDLKLEVVTQADEMMLDCLLAVWMLKAQAIKSDEKSVKVIGEIFGALGGIGA